MKQLYLDALCHELVPVEPLEVIGPPADQPHLGRKVRVRVTKTTGAYPKGYECEERPYWLVFKVPRGGYFIWCRSASLAEIRARIAA